VASWRLRLDPSTRRTDGGRTLVGGTPLRILRLSPAGQAWLDRVAAGDELPPGDASSALARRLVDGGLAVPVPPDGAGPPIAEVAVVIPVRDDPVGVAVATTGLEVAEVVVVDDGSSSPLAFDVVRVLRHEVNLGPAAARETGWRASAAPFVAFVDADVQLPDSWLDGLLPHFADPTVGAVAPRVRARAGEAPGWLAEYEADRSPIDMGADAAAVRPGSRVPYVPTAVLVVRRDALEAVGGFDAGLRFGEDVDLCWRLHQAGWRIRYEPAVEATHPARSSLSGWLRQRFAYGSSAATLAERHGDAVAPLRGMSGWSALAWGSVLAGHPIAGATVMGGTTVALSRKLGSLDDPMGEAVRIAAPGHLWAGRATADALRRTWWPLAVVLALVHRRSRPALLAALLLPITDRIGGSNIAHGHVAAPDSLGVGRYVALRVLDDAAYGAGVWAGCLRARSWRALVPSFSGPLPPPTEA
jgi:mycofactocin system glycosyltransferase